jgi:hypothetical protein
VLLTRPTDYLYDGPNLMEEVDSSGNVLARYTQSSHETEGPLVDEALAELRSGTTSYYQPDGLGSITSLSNVAGTLANTYTYDFFGKLTASTGRAIYHFSAGECTERGRQVKALRFAPTATRRAQNAGPGLTSLSAPVLLPARKK